MPLWRFEERLQTLLGPATWRAKPKLKAEGVSERAHIRIVAWELPECKRKLSRAKTRQWKCNYPMPAHFLPRNPVKDASTLACIRCGALTISDLLGASK